MIKKKVETGYDLYLKKQKQLLKLVKNKGILVKRMEVGDNFLFDRPLNSIYKRNLGAVEVYDLFRKKIKSVYVVYEDFDGSIKYYDYPQNNPSTPSTFSFYVRPFLILLMTFMAILVIEAFVGFDSVIEFAIYLIVINLILNVSYAFFVRRKAKRRFR